MSINVQANRGSVSSVSVLRDVDGFPKLNKESAIKFWPMLSVKDRKFLKEKFNINLEI